MKALGNSGVILKPFSCDVRIIITTHGRPMPVYKRLECTHARVCMHSIHMCIQHNHGEMDKRNIYS